MNAVFADVFYWIAFTNVQDFAHERAKAFTRSAKPDVIYTTEEVLTEYLNYFGLWRPSGTELPSSGPRYTCSRDAKLFCLRGGAYIKKGT